MSKKPFTYLEEASQTRILETAKELNISKNQIKAYTKARAVLLTDQDRGSVFSKLESLGYKRDISLAGSSIGGMSHPSGTEIIVKPLSKQGVNSAGKLNEKKFMDLVVSYISSSGDPIKVQFKSTTTTLQYEDVLDCKDSSYSEASTYSKADASLIDSSGEEVVGISLKKKNACRWESSKSRKVGGIYIFDSFIDKVHKMDEQIEKPLYFKNVSLFPLKPENKYKLYSPKQEKVLSRVVVTNSPSEVMEEVVFGANKDKTIVIKETFEDGFNSYSFSNNTLVIECDTIYTNIVELHDTEDEPQFAFSNHIGQSYGVEFRSFSKGRLYKGNSLRGFSTEIKFDKLL